MIHPASESAQPRLRRRWLWRFIVLVLLTGLLWWTLSDEPPPDTTDLQPRARTLPDIDNALLVIRAIAVERAPETKSETYQADLAQLTRHPEIWNEAATRLVSVRADLWPRFDAALRLPRAEAPLPQSIKDVPPPHFSDTHDLWSIATLRARSLAHTQSADAGLLLAIAQLESLHAQTNAGGVLIDYLGTAAFRGRTLHTIEDILLESQPSAPALRDALQRLRPARPAPDALAETFRAEHLFFIRSLSDSGQWVNNEFTIGIYGKPPLGAAWFFKPNKTIRLHTEELRAVLPLIGRPFDHLRESFSHRPKQSAAFFGRIPHPDNALGRYALSLISDVYFSILKTWLRDQTRYSAIEAALAATCYQRDHGAFPETLDVLVPAYLPAVPRDYFDGAPIRYSRDLGVLWSVGENNLTVSRADQSGEPGNIIVHLTSRSQPSAK